MRSWTIASFVWSFHLPGIDPSNARRDAAHIAQAARLHAELGHVGSHSGSIYAKAALLNPHEKYGRTQIPLSLTSPSSKPGVFQRMRDATSFAPRGGVPERRKRGEWEGSQSLAASPASGLDPRAVSAGAVLWGLTLGAAWYRRQRCHLRIRPVCMTADDANFALLPRGTDEATLKRRFRELSRQLHPDING